MFVVTGATGFIGSVMVWELNQQGVSDILISDLIPPERRQAMMAGLKYTQFVPAEELLTHLHSRKEGFSAIFHMGACSSTTEMDVDYLKRINTDYTKSLWEFCRDKDIPFIYASSGAVYGDGKLGFSDEPPSRRYQPLNPYGWSKLNFDVWAELQSETPSHWFGLRFFNVYGPHEYFKDNMASLVFKATQQIKDTGRLKLFRSHHPDYADGEQKRDFVYVKDITQWMWQLYKTQPSPNGIYNMGFGKARTWLDLARNVFMQLNLPMQIDWIDIPENIRNQYQYFTEADDRRLISLGLSRPQWSLEKGVEDYLKNYLLQTSPFLK